MSAQFSKGDRVEIIGSADEGLGAGFPVGGTGTVHTLHLFPDDGMVYVRLDGEDAMHAWFPPANLRKVEPATELEDKDDPYVEPEPLKEGDWVQVWAQVRRADYEAEVHKLQVFTSRHGGEDLGIVDDPGVIVRPDAGRVPPWLVEAEVVEPTGLGAVVEAEVVHRRIFVRAARADTAAAWRTPGIDYLYSWADLKNPKVIAPGWTEGGAS